MTKLLQVNITANWGSHGKIAEGIGQLAIHEGWESHIAYGRWMNPSESKLYHIGSMFDERIHGLASRILDNQGLMSKKVTKKFIDYVKKLSPDIIHLHNIHGYYLNYPLLMDFLVAYGKPVVWTLHDCWSFTGHCAHYMFAGCNKWQSHCHNCAQKKEYPSSLLLDNSFKNFDLKKKYFTSIQDLTLVPVSKWLEDDISKSFLKNIHCHQIYNGIDVNTFYPDKSLNIRKKYGLAESTKIILGVASNWYHKGLEDFGELATQIKGNYKIILVGVNEKDVKKIPNEIIKIKRTEDINEMRNLYSQADVFFNPTIEDNFPTTNIESLSCGTPVITYNTGGCKEAITEGTGFTINQKDLKEGIRKIEAICSYGKDFYKNVCRQRAINNFDKNIRFKEYLNLYKELLHKSTN